MTDYNWLQYSLHRGKLQMEPYKTLVKRVGPDAIHTNHAAKQYENTDGVVLHLNCPDGATTTSSKVLLVAYGINSTIRVQMYSSEGEPVWNDCVLWHATSRGKAFRTGASMILAGYNDIRFVAYPITEPDAETGEAEINWIAEIRRDPGEGWLKAGYNTASDINTFLPTFSN